MKCGVLWLRVSERRLSSCKLIIPRGTFLLAVYSADQMEWAEQEEKVILGKYVSYFLRTSLFRGKCFLFW